ncbi:MAG: hypothetical protein GX640_00900 [Fibrobacter sp.]|nr:hypothetical protein [Fibrobacter sp.]
MPIVATLAINNATDNAKLVVGKPRAKFWIFFGDTANFDPSVEIKGCALSSRFPITLRASTDGKTILTDINAGFEIEADQQLVFYATQDDTVPITQSALKNGTLKIWVKGNRPVSNGVVTINSKDNTVLSSTRPGIVFEQCTPEVERAAYFGDGLGQVNRLEIYYSKELEAIYVPDSFLLYWPTISPNNARVVSGATNIIVDPNNSKHLTVKIPVPFGPENTFSSIKNLGSSYWSANKLSNDPPSISPFNISDSIGPLLMSATIVERIGDTGDDTLYLTLSEQINFKLLEGTSLTLLKNGSPVNLTVSSCTPFNGDTLKIVIPNGAANSPKYGDSLKILASGPVRDLYGNAAHVDNRPVKIGIKLIPPSIVSASYTDANGNGIVDLVTIKFDKKIVQGTVKIACSWLDLIISSDTLHGADILYDPNDSMLVRVNIEGKFRTNSARVIDKTSGSMDVAAMFDGFESVAKHHEAEDKAAPVIKSATYMPGRVDTITGTPLPDTLKVKFSESTVNVANSDKPFSVYHGTVEMAGFILGPASGNEECIYIVQQAEYFPVRDDSINIRATDSILSDGLGNIQIVPSNKKVQLEVKVVETVLKFVVGPNPFKPGVDELSIKIKPMSKMMENVNVKSTLVVVDQLGNKVWVKNLQTDTTLTDRTLEFKWNGRNRFGRTVSPGTYIAYLISEDLNTKTQVKHPPMFAIGVKK